MNLAIQIDRLKKSYGDHTVLKSVSFHVIKGEIFALLGVNGAGKTTALECMEGLRKYDSGSIVVSGKMGIQLQSASLPAHIKPMEAVRLFAGWNKAKIDDSMLAALGMTSLKKLSVSSSFVFWTHLRKIGINSPLNIYERIQQ